MDIVMALACAFLGLFLIAIGAYSIWGPFREERMLCLLLAKKEQQLAKKEQLLAELEKKLAELHENLNKQQENLDRINQNLQKKEALQAKIEQSLDERHEMLTRWAQEHGLAELPAKFEKEI